MPVASRRPVSDRKGSILAGPTRRRMLSAGLCGIAGALAPRKAHADALRIQWATRVAAGERPKLVLIANEALDGVEVSVKDGGGRTTSAKVTVLHVGAEHVVMLPALPGRQRYTGSIVIRRGTAVQKQPISFETIVAGRLEIAIDRARVDLPNRRLEAVLSRPAAKVEISVIGTASGTALVTTEQDLGGRPAGSKLVVTWPQPPGQAALGEADIARIDLRFTDTDGFYGSVALLPWRITIPHEEIAFAVDSATIEPEQEGKLRASLDKIADAWEHHRGLGAVKLYVAGHTDSVGTPEHNLRLSRARAAAIAGWFRRRKLALPILSEGFGEHAPLVPRPDETDEPRNRRVDYILALEDPIIAVATAARFVPTWRRAP